VTEDIFRTAGFARNELHQVLRSPQQLIVSVKTSRGRMEAGREPARG